MGDAKHRPLLFPTLKAIFLSPQGTSAGQSIPLSIRTAPEGMFIALVTQEGVRISGYIPRKRTFVIKMSPNSTQLRRHSVASPLSAPGKIRRQKMYSEDSDLTGVLS